MPSCPGWDLGKLVAHLGRVFSWATEALSGGGAAPGRPPASPEGDAVVAWFEAAAARLGEACRVVPATAPAWNFAGAPATAAFWTRRQAQESTIHCWDAQHAVGESTTIDPALAVDGIDEYLTVIAPYLVGRRDGIDTGGSIHLHATDADGEWTVHTDDGVLRVDHGHAKGDVAVRGPSAYLLLLVWQRASVSDDDALQLFGDADVLDRWLALGTP